MSDSESRIDSRATSGGPGNPALGDPALVTWPPDLARESATVGARVGENYELLEQIGQGGMGVVYRARQLRPVERIVAIKLIKLGIDTPQLVARFQSERQALAVLEHPGISRVYDAGTTDTGRPYFVMEFVSGTPINVYCDDHRLSTAARLELFRQVCSAVQHAHFNGIVHRDLKPSNVLVADVDGQPQAKIIDFGIAKAIHGSARAGLSSMVTDAGQFVGTPVYSSPEQTTGEDLDTRADIYSLGVMLYELLSGALPFDETHYSKARGAAPSADAPRPSTRLSMLGDATTKFAALRGLDSTSLRRQLRGDLDLIVMKAMHPDRSQRYDSAAALSEDLRRYLAHEPILARPPTLAYEARKFARRNRAFVTAASLVLVALVAGAALATIGFVRANTARKEEQAQRLVAQHVSEFLADMLSSVDPERAQGKQVLVRDVLDQASKELPTRFQTQPVVAASLHKIIGQTYSSLGLSDVALTHMKSAFDLREKALGADHLDTLDAKRWRASISSDLGREKEAEVIYRELVEKFRRVAGPDAPETLRAEDGLALVLQHLNRAQEAEPLQRHVLDVYRRRYGEEHVSTLHAMHNLAPIVEQLGQPEESERLNRFVAETRLRKLGADHPDTLLSQSNHSGDLLRLKRFDEAVTVIRDLLARNERVNGVDHPNTLLCLNNLAIALESSGKDDEAITILQQLVERVRRTLPVAHPNTMVTIANLAQILEEQKRIDEALVYYKELYDLAPKSTMPPQFVAEYMAEYAFKLVQHGRLDQAEGPLLEAKRRFEAANLRTRPKMQRLMKGLIELCEKSGRFEEALRYREELDRIVAQASTMPASQPRR